MPSSPGWSYGFIPSPQQWNDTFAGKVDYPAPISQGGTGAEDAPGANYLIQQRRLIAASIDALPLTLYFVRTSVGAITIQLPPLSSLLRGDWIDIADVDYAAETHNVTILGAGVDQIALYDTAAGSQTLDIAGARCTLVANTTNWRMLV